LYIVTSPAMHLLLLTAQLIFLLSLFIHIIRVTFEREHWYLTSPNRAHPTYPRL
jgi:hypothetical protein